MVAESEGVVAGGGSDDALGFLLLRQAQQCVPGASFLKRAGQESDPGVGIIVKTK